RRRDRRGRAAQLRTRAQRGQESGDRVPPRGARLCPPLDPGSLDLERRERGGYAERAARGARRGRSPRRLLLVDVGLRLNAGAADDRRVAARPDLAVSGHEARRRAVLRQLLARLRVVRIGRAALLQRLRAATEPVLAV